MLDALLCSGLVGFLTPTPPAPPPQFPEWQPVSVLHQVVTKRNAKLDFSGKLLQLGTMPPLVKEYGHPCIHIMASGVTLQNYYWMGSMEGVHVGSQIFTGKGMRQPHQPISATLDHLFCRNIGEDCISIQPRSKVWLTNSEFQGECRLHNAVEGDQPGCDKILQIDGAEVVIENCTFRNAFTALRAKANSKVTLRNCNFIDCQNAITGDGMPNPRLGQEYDNGREGLCRITVENCHFWRCQYLFHAFRNCEIITYSCVGYRSWYWMAADKGKVFGK